MRWLLDDEVPSGPLSATVSLRPARWAKYVHEEDYPAALADIARSCEVWGGACDLLVPVAGGATVDHYRWLVERESLDLIRPNDTVSPPLAGVREAGGGVRVPAIAAAGTFSKEQLPRVSVPEIESSHPWATAYAAVFGMLPVGPSKDLVDWYGLKDELTYGQVVELDFDADFDAGVADMLKRLRSREAIWPVDLTLLRLQRRPLRQVQWSLDGWLHDRAAFARQSDSDVLVIYKPGSTGDLALLWNLRRLHGVPRGLPLGIPFATEQTCVEDIAELLGSLQLFAGLPVSLVSTSVDRNSLNSISDGLRERGFAPDVVELGDVLVPSQSPARVAATHLQFDGGAALVSTRTDRDRSEIEALDRWRPTKDLMAVVELDERPLPFSVGASAIARFEMTVGEGGLKFQADNPDKIQRLTWPSNWSVFEMATRTAGVEVTPSQEGIVAHALLERIGDLDSLRWFQSRPLINFLYTVSESSGMSWWKRRSTEQAQRIYDAGDVTEEALNALRDAIEEVHVSGGPSEAPTFGFGNLKSALGSAPAATAWLAWAEEHGLIHRGLSVACRRCKNKAWMSVRSIADLTCVACGREIEAPFPNPASLTFTYRLAEPLARAIEHDVLYPLLAMRTVWTCLVTSPTPLVGVYPGVEFRRDGKLREADFVALQVDGSILLAEVKRTARHMTDGEIAKVEEAAGWLGAENVVLAVGEPDAALTPEILSAARGDVTPRVLLLTADDWLDPGPRVGFGERFPGPDLSGDGSNPRIATADSHDAAFADAIESWTAVE